MTRLRNFAMNDSIGGSQGITDFRVQSSAAKGGLRSTDSQRPFFLGEDHLRPILPRPPVCVSAKITDPSDSASRALQSISSFVDVVESTTVIFLPMMVPVDSLDCKSSANSKSGLFISLYPLCGLAMISKPDWRKVSI